MIPQVVRNRTLAVSTAAPCTATPAASTHATSAPGAAQESQVYRLISTTDEEDRMPKKADPLPAGQVAIIQRWIDQGAKFDGPDPAAAEVMMPGLPAGRRAPACSLESSGLPCLESS